MIGLLRLCTRASLLTIVLGQTAFADDQTQRHKIETVIVADYEETSADPTPGNTETVTAGDAATRINVVNTEDILKYLPDVLVRKRHIGDTQDPITTRTSGVGASARSLIYADGILLSALIGNNNSSASPRWGMVAPEDVARIDVMYGPFAAEYPGNSVGAVINLTTRMPDALEMHAKTEGAFQVFDQYATKDTYSTYQMSAGIGDRKGNFAFRLGANYLNTFGQPLSFVTLTRPAAASGAGTPVSGAFAGVNRANTPIALLGAGGIEHQKQGNVTLKLAYDLKNDMTASYTLAIFNQIDNATVQSYLRDTNGDTIYTGSVNIGGYNYNIPANAFSNGAYRSGQTHMAHALSLISRGADWEWSANLSLYDFVRDLQRSPAAPLPDAFSGGAGTIARMDGTGWYTADVKARHGFGGTNTLSFGAHYDRYKLSMKKFNTANWLTGPQGALAAASRGKTATGAIWLQDAWRFAPEWKLTVGGRLESWRAVDGFNYSLSPALSVTQPRLSGSYFSPKASLAWHPAAPWTVTASYGRAYRMPTVTELYQAITTGSVLSVPNPSLNPERADSYDLSAERNSTDGRIRLSLFEEDLADALISQSAPLPPGSTTSLPPGTATLFNFVQNVDRVRSRGIEAVLEQNDVVFEGLELSGSVTYLDSRITKDSAFAAAIGKNTPQLPKWRGTLVATYRPDDAWALSLAARYSDRSFGTIDNSDVISHTYQGFEGYFVLDTRVHYDIDEHWSAAFGVDNLNNRKYFIFHPFPQRTFLVELRYAQ